MKRKDIFAILFYARDKDGKEMGLQKFHWVMIATIIVVVIGICCVLVIATIRKRKRDRYKCNIQSSTGTEPGTIAREKSTSVKGSTEHEEITDEGSTTPCRYYI